MKKDILIAYAFDGMGYEYKKVVNRICVWIGSKGEHFICDESVSALINEANKTNRMQVFITDNNKIDGKIDAHNSIPLYTIGQKSVSKLEYNGEIIWLKK